MLVKRFVSVAVAALMVVSGAAAGASLRRAEQVAVAVPAPVPQPVAAHASLTEGVPEEAPHDLEADDPVAPPAAVAVPAAAAPAVVVAAPPPNTVAPVAAVRTSKGYVLPALSGSGSGWTVVTPCGATRFVTAKPIEAVDVVLDPGHGGSETGAIGPNGLVEKELNVAVTSVTAAALAAQGVRVIVTRHNDQRTSLATRALTAKGAKSKAFVSIHHNSGSPLPSTHPGTEAWAQVDSPHAYRLAELISAEVSAALLPFGTGWTANSVVGARVRRSDSGGDYYGILRRAKGIPSVISEAAFVNNPVEAALLSTPEVQRAEGEAIARAIVKFLALKAPVEAGIPVEAPRAAAGCVDPAL